MRKFLTFMMLMLLVTISFDVSSQTQNLQNPLGLSITTLTDNATNNEYAYFNYDFVVQKSPDSGVGITVVLKSYNNNVQYQSMNVQVLGMKQCYDDWELTFLLDNGNSICLNSYSKLKNSEYFYCASNLSEFTQLTNNKLISLTITNSCNEPQTFYVPLNRQEYFMEAYQVLKTLTTNKA
jgi:hypothetical protein